MTQTQIGYWNYVESKRHNTVIETVEVGKLQETKRHNQVTEDQGNQRLLLDMSALNETIRHNTQTEAVQWYDAKTRRKQQKENVRHDKADEKIRGKEARTNAKNAKTNAKNATTNAKNAATNARNAETNARNADINAQNADTNARMADLKETEIKNHWELTKAQIGETNARAALTKTQDEYYLLSLYVNAKDPVRALAALGFMAADEVEATAKAINDYKKATSKKGSTTHISASDLKHGGGGDSLSLQQFSKSNPNSARELKKLGSILKTSWSQFKSFN